MSGTKIYDEKLMFAEQVASKFFRYENEKNNRKVYSKYLKGLDGANDYILIEQQDSGYAIFSSVDMQLVEYSEHSVSPYNKLSANESYYAGPGNYYVKKDDQMTSMNTGEVLDNSVLSVMATGIKNKVSSRKEEVETTADLHAGQLDNELQSVIMGTDEEIYDANRFEVKERKYISNKDYFFSNPLYGNNTTGTCTTVATQLLLSYNNWACDARLIDDSGFLYNENYLSYEKKPFNQLFMSTTSINSDQDDVITFYEQLLEYIDPNEHLATLTDAKNGVNQYLNNHVAQNVREQVSMGTISLVESNLINIKNKLKSEVDNGRPALALINYWKNKGDNKEGIAFHTVVVYGYQTFVINGNEEFGFIAHFGWDKDSYCKWFNQSWLLSCLYFQTSHQHTYSMQDTYNHIQTCGSCGALSVASDHVYYVKNSFTNDGHDTVCACGHTVQQSHELYYVPLSDKNHIVNCYLCSFSKKEEHFFKIDSCWTCGKEKEEWL